MRVIPSLSRGLRILELLAESDTPLKAGEISKTLEIPRSATYELLHTLKEHNAVREVEGGRNSLGPLVFALGTAYKRTVDLPTVATEVAEKARDRSGETVQVAVLDRREVLYVAKAESSHAVRLVSEVGRKLPAHCTGLGKVLLAALSDEEFDDLLGGTVLPAMTEHSITDLEVLRTQLKKVREDGYAIETSESNLEVGCIAAPVRDDTGETVAAISISAPLSRFTEDRFELLRLILLEAADELSAALGAPKPKVAVA